MKTKGTNKEATLLNYIKNHYGGRKSKFARKIGVAPAQITQWLKKDFIVVDHKLYSVRRDLI